MNTVFLCGNIGKDPDMRLTLGGTAVCTFSLATVERVKDKEGQHQNKTTWHNIIAWGKTSEAISKYFKKGDPILLQGSIENSSWDDKDGNKRYKTEVRVNRWEFTHGSKRDHDTGAPRETEMQDHGEPYNQDQSQGDY